MRISLRIQPRKGCSGMALSSIQETQPQACLGESRGTNENPGLRGATAAPLRKRWGGQSQLWLGDYARHGLRSVPIHPVIGDCLRPVSRAISRRLQCLPQHALADPHSGCSPAAGSHHLHSFRRYSSDKMVDGGRTLTPVVPITRGGDILMLQQLLTVHVPRLSTTRKSCQ